MINLKFKVWSLFRQRKNADHVADKIIKHTCKSMFSIECSQLLVLQFIKKKLNNLEANTKPKEYCIKHFKKPLGAIPISIFI